MIINEDLKEQRIIIERKRIAANAKRQKSVNLFKPRVENRIKQKSMESEMRYAAKR
jgi:hypothetical protein